MIKQILEKIKNESKTKIDRFDKIIILHCLFCISMLIISIIFKIGLKSNKYFFIIAFFSSLGISVYKLY